MKDILIIIALILFIAASFYAFQLLVIGIFGVVVYFALPFIKKFLSRRSRWK